MSRLPTSVDRMPVEARKPRAGPLLDSGEVIACALNYAMQFEFWKREINERSMVVHAIEKALLAEGYEIIAIGKQKEK